VDAGTILLIAIPVLVVLAGVAVASAARRRDRAGATGFLSRETRRRDRSESPFLAGDEETALRGRAYERQAELQRRPSQELVPAGPSRAPVPYAPPDPETLGVTRRQFFNRSIVAMFGLGLTGFGAAVLAFLWPKLGAGFGATIRVGSLEDVLGTIRDTREPVYVPEGRFYINPYPREAADAAASVYTGAVLAGMQQGVVALYQKCPHLGCRVPWCATSQWFECPCHGSQYNRVGEKKGGPAPRGMDQFGVAIEGGVVAVDTSLVVEGAPIGTNTTGQEAEGPHCIGAGSEEGH
jgi:cytochrome b6-f complex iron-sulfur subunit